MAQSFIIVLLFDLVELINIYTYVVIAAVVVSWLIAFGVINTFNPYARTFVRFLDAVTEPLFRPIRRVVPPIGGFDLSPLLLYFLLQLLMQEIIIVAERL